MPLIARRWLTLMALGVGLALGVGILDRGYWTPDEPREADIAWRMSWQADKALPLLAGEPFCEKPPLTYWVAAPAIRAFGQHAWAARLPNLLYALVTALCVGLLGRRGAGDLAGIAAAAAISTFLLSYQVTIWLATDAPLLAAAAASLLGLYLGFHANSRRARLMGYTLMHTAMALGFLAKSAAGWLVPVLCLLCLVVWERRWRELLRWELYAGLLVQAALILTWVGFVVAEPQGIAHLKVFFWNNLAGRFARVDASADLQYAQGHRNTPGKYLLEMPVYLWPWTLLVLAAARRGGRRWKASGADRPLLRFAVASLIPTLGVLSLAATARNIYLAPALPGAALLLGWWVRDVGEAPDPWDVRALRLTAILLMVAVLVMGAVLIVVGADAWSIDTHRAVYALIGAAGEAAAAVAVLWGWRLAGKERLRPALLALLLAYCALLIGPASQVYRRVDTWQDLSAVGHGIARDAADRPLMVFAPDETTRALVDLYTSTRADTIEGPIDVAARERLSHWLRDRPDGLVVTQWPGRTPNHHWPALTARWRLGGQQGAAAEEIPSWAAALNLSIAHRYDLPNGRRYVMWVRGAATAAQ